MIFFLIYCNGALNDQLPTVPSALTCLCFSSSPGVTICRDIRCASIALWSLLFTRTGSMVTSFPLWHPHPKMECACKPVVYFNQFLGAWSSQNKINVPPQGVNQLLHVHQLCKVDKNTFFCSFSDVFVDFSSEITEKGSKLRKKLKNGWKK